MKRSNKYIQMSLSDFLLRYPDCVVDFPFLKELIDDPLFVVRIRLDGSEFEVGYSDDDWNIK